MDIVIFGGLHDGLDHRDRFRSELKREIGARGGEPKFVAVEWREEVYRALTAERDWLEARLRERWPGADQRVIGLAGTSLCWEADTHLSILPDETPVIYLDGLLERKLDKWAVSDPRDFLVYNKAAPLVGAISKEAAKSVQAAIAASNAVSWQAARQKMPERPDREQREPVWADAIADRARLAEVGWGVAVVGAAHGTRFDRYSLPCQLDQRGIRSTSMYISRPSWADDADCDRA